MDADQTRSDARKKAALKQRVAQLLALRNTILEYCIMGQCPFKFSARSRSVLNNIVRAPLQSIFYRRKMPREEVGSLFVTFTVLPGGCLPPDGSRELFPHRRSKTLGRFLIFNSPKLVLADV